MLKVWKRYCFSVTMENVLSLNDGATPHGFRWVYKTFKLTNKTNLKQYMKWTKSKLELDSYRCLLLLDWSSSSWLVGDSGHLQALNLIQNSFNIWKAVTEAVKVSQKRRPPNPGGLLLHTNLGRLLMPKIRKLAHLGFHIQPTRRPTNTATHKGTKLAEQSNTVSNNEDDLFSYKKAK